MADIGKYAFCLLLFGQFVYCYSAK